MVNYVVFLLLSIDLQIELQYFMNSTFIFATYSREVNLILGERTGLVVRASDSGLGDPGSILGQVGVLFP